jgi:hypothetical protein
MGDVLVCAERRDDAYWPVSAPVVADPEDRAGMITHIPGAIALVPFTDRNEQRAILPEGPPRPKIQVHSTPGIGNEDIMDVRQRRADLAVEGGINRMTTSATAARPRCMRRLDVDCVSCPRRAFDWRRPLVPLTQPPRDRESLCAPDG